MGQLYNHINKEWY